MVARPGHGRSWALAGVVLAVAVSGGALWYWLAGTETAPRYETVAVSRGAIRETVTASGQLNPVVSVAVGSQVSGIIEQLFVDFNDAVRVGQVIAQLDSSTYAADLRRAEGELDSARAALGLAQVKADRASELRAKDLIPQAEYDEVHAALQQAAATVVIRDASVRKARIDLERCTIVSPIDGVVISRNVDVGQTVAASLSAPTLFVIANDLTRMQINANVAEADIGGVRSGQSVTFTVDAFPARTFEGRVVQVRNAPITVQNVVTYDTIIEVDNPDGALKPGMTATVSIVVASKDDVLMVPNVALRLRLPGVPTGESGAGGRTDGGFAAAVEGRGVYTVAPGKGAQVLSRVAVATGISDGVNTEIVKGLDEGMLVVTGLRRTSNLAERSRSTNPISGGRRF